MEKKKCGDCEHPYTYDNFCQKKGTPDGYSYYCRGCTSKSAKKYYKNNEGVRKKIVKRNDQAKLEARKFVMNYLLNHSCVNCPEKRPECLDFDHQRDKIHGVSYLAAHGYSIETIQEEIEKCQIL